MKHFNVSLDDVSDTGLVIGYPYNEAARLPYCSHYNLVKVQIKGYDFARLSKSFLPLPEFTCPSNSQNENVYYYKCNPPSGDRTYELPSNVMRVEAHTASFLPLIPQPKSDFDEAPEHVAYRELQQKRWVKLLSQIDDLWWALMIEPHYINGRFDEVNELIQGFYYALSPRERIENIMRILSAEWYDNEDIGYWMSQVNDLHKVKLDREREIIESGNIACIQRLS